MNMFKRINATTEIPDQCRARKAEEKQPVLFQPIPVLDDSTVLRMPLVRTTAGAATCAPGRLLVIGGAPETSMCSAEVREGYMSSDGEASKYVIHDHL